MPLRIYLDTSVYNRPFDDQRQLRIWLEALAVSVILQMIRAGEMDLLTSSVVAYETSKNPYPERRRSVWEATALAVETIRITPGIRQRAQELEAGGIKALDALHLASAEAASADFFITCDDRLIRQYGRRTDTIPAISDPVAFVSGQVSQEGRIIS